MARRKIDSRPFEIAARLPIQLGREAISSSNVALTEIVKNAYDADANNVWIKFRGLRSENPSLLIRDDGQGMTLSTLQDHWLKIGTTNKTDKIRSEKYRRTLSGAKGLGRLGLDRLSESITLYTKRPRAKSSVEIAVDWHKYEKSKAVFSDITHDIFSANGEIDVGGESIFARNSDSGTCIVLNSLKEHWDKHDLQKLHKQLELLISPFGFDQDFKIHFESGIEELDGEIQTAHLLQVAPLRVEASIVKSKNKQFTIDFSVVDAQEAIVQAAEGISWSEFTNSTGGETPDCGPLSFDLYYMPQKSDFFEGVLSKESKAFMREHYGVRVYRDNMRVLPYGEPSGAGDWLNLGKRAQGSPGGIAQGGWRANVYQVIGAVKLSRISNPTLVDQANREGILEGKAFYDLELFVLSTIKRFELIAHKLAKSKKESSQTKLDKTTEAYKHAEEKASESKGKIKEKLLALQDGDAVSTDQISDLIDDFSSFETKMTNLTSASKKQRDELENRSKELETEKNTLSNLASIGILAVAFGHETIQYANDSLMSGIDLRDSLKGKKIKLDEDEIEMLDTVIDSSEFLQGYSNFYLSTVLPNKRKLKSLSPFSSLNSTIRALKTPLKRKNIDVDIVKDDEVIDFRVSGFEIDLESLYINLITNSVHALRLRPIDQRKISVEFKIISQGEVLRLVFADSGEGISKLDLKEIFTPMYSSKVDKRGAQIGTGMGLTISKSIVEEHMGGKIKVNGKSELGGAQFVIDFPKRHKRGPGKNAKRSNIH